MYGQDREVDTGLLHSEHGLRHYVSTQRLDYVLSQLSTVCLLAAELSAHRVNPHEGQLGLLFLKHIRPHLLHARLVVTE